MPTPDEWTQYAEVTWPDRIGIFAAAFRAHRFPKHWHETVAVGVTEAGAGETWYRGSVHGVRPGQVMVVDAGEVHSGRALASDSAWTYRMLYFQPEYIRLLASHWAERPVPDVVLGGPAIPDLRIAQSLRLLARGLLRHPSNRVLQEGALIDTFSLLFRRHATVGTRARASGHGQHHDQQLVEDIKEYLDAHVGGGGSVTELATLLGRSRFALSRAFVRATGMAPYAWLEQRRIERATMLLREGVAIADVVFRLGFSDQSHFTRRFRKVHGVPPGTYVRMVRTADRKPSRFFNEDTA